MFRTVFQAFRALMETPQTQKWFYLELKVSVYCSVSHTSVRYNRRASCFTVNTDWIELLTSHIRTPPLWVCVCVYTCLSVNVGTTISAKICGVLTVTLQTNMEDIMWSGAATSPVATERDSTALENSRINRMELSFQPFCQKTFYLSCRYTNCTQKLFVSAHGHKVQ